MADENETMPLCEEVFRLPSPPKPTRMIQTEAKPQQPVKEFVQNTSSLPALAGEVAVAQKNQVLRLEKRMEFLQNLQVDYREALRLRSFAEKHTQGILRKSNILQDDIESCQKNCEGLQKEINVLISDNETLKGSIASEEHDLASEKCNYAVYQAKMKKYKEVADLVESSDAVNANIASKMKHYETLSDEKKSLQKNNDIPRLLSGEMKEIIMAEILTLDESNLRDSLKRKYQTVEEKERQAKLRKEVELLQKKNQAQLTWTRKQLQETVARNQQWNGEISRKEKEIQEKRRMLEQ